VHIFAFHHITPQPRSQFDVTPKVLAELLARLRASGVRIAAPREVLGLLGAHATPADPEASAVIVFDDGYRSTLEHAMPLMREHAVVFGMAPVLATMLDGERPTRFAHSSTEFIDQHGLQTWLAAGGELIGHSYSHLALDTVATSTIEFELDRELAAYRALDIPAPVMFAYPFGASDARVRRLVARHYQAALATGDGRRACAESRYELHRITFRTQRIEALARLDWAVLEGSAA
jgi:peptidoglycan/xylan/chitin deacetylase (PgdA/CDA1 family)